MNKSPKTSPPDTYPVTLVGYLDTKSSWHIVKSQDADPMFKCEAGMDDQWRRFPIEEVAKAYLGLENADQVEDFLRMYGPFRTRGPFGVGEVLDQPGEVKCISFLRMVWAWRAYLISGSLVGNAREPNPYKITKPAVDWFNKQAEAPFDAKIRFRQGLQSVIVCEDVEEAVRAFVFLERLAGREWDRCANPACGAPYRKCYAKGRTCRKKCLSVLTSQDFRKRHKKPGIKDNSANVRPGATERRRPAPAAPHSLSPLAAREH